MMVNETKTDFLANKGNADIFTFINCVLNAPLMLIAIIGNSLVLAAILRTPSLRSPSTVFLCSLAVSDLLVGLVVQPVYIALKMKFGRPLLQPFQISSGTLCAVSLFTMATISVDRFVALRCHMRYQDLMTAKRATYISPAIWFFCVLLSCIHFLSETMFFLAITVSIVKCLSISCFAYVRIYQIVRHHQLQIQAQQQAVESLNTEHNLNMMRSKKSAINTFIYFICMVLCYTPMSICSMIFASFGKEWEALWGLANTLLFLNSSVNPFLYCWRLSELRAAAVKTLRKMLCKRPEET